MLRDAGLWHARDERRRGGPRRRRRRSSTVFLKEQRVTTADTYGALLEREVPVLADGPIYRLVHDDLSEHWHPVWFAEFAEHAAAPRARLRRRGRPVQPAHRDAARGRRAGGVAARRRRPDRVRELQRPADRAPLPPERRSATRARPLPRPSPSPERAQRLHWAVRPNAEPLEVGLIADAFAELDRRRPQARRLRRAARRARTPTPDALAEALLDGFRRERLIPHAGPLRAASDPGERPIASPLARWQAAQGAGPHLARLHDACAWRSPRRAC